MNRYVRAPGFLVCEIFPMGMLFLHLSVIIRYYKNLTPLMRTSTLLFVLMPTVATVVQIFAYGVSLTNMSTVGAAMQFYMFTLVDLDRAAEKAIQMQIEFLQDEQKDIHTLFVQTAEALSGAIDAKDKYTHGHSLRVAEYSRKIAALAGMDESECEEVYFAGLLHDVGKIGISDSIINKEGTLNDEEFHVIQRHPVIGRQILSSIGKSPYLSIGAHHHHEHYDGTGYPDHLKGNDIPVAARIIAVADAYDAMTSKRSYRDPIPQQRVREEIVKGIGKQFDPLYAKLMLQLMDQDSEYQMKDDGGREG
jgi:HD-GYP domain-containing protein (c-di-GMP phosphodiesterase class II)